MFGPVIEGAGSGPRGVDRRVSHRCHHLLRFVDHPQEAPKLRGSHTTPTPGSSPVTGAGDKGELITRLQEFAEVTCVGRPRRLARSQIP